MVDGDQSSIMANHGWGWLLVNGWLLTMVKGDQWWLMVINGDRWFMVISGD